MEKPICRICLAKDVRMHSIFNTDLQYIYEKLTELPLSSTGNNADLLACYLCYARLKNCHHLSLQCYRSQLILKDVLNSAQNHAAIDKQPYFLLSKVTVAQIINISKDDDTCVKNEEFNVKVKDEDTELSPEPHETLDDLGTPPSDSEDDVPLTRLKRETVEECESEREEKRRHRKAAGHDCTELLLTKQQQIDALTSRATSHNYTHAPYKCSLCYRGFVTSSAHDNHRRRHAESSGPHECDVCHMRYLTPQLLKTHEMTSHARLYKCNKCGQTCHTMNQARVHEKWHSGYTYECKLCSHKFRKPTSYLSHLRKRHPTENVCNICGASFVGTQGLQMHRKKAHHDEKVELPENAAKCFCAECNIQFYSLDAWKTHVLNSVKHTLNNDNSSDCSICGSTVQGSLLAHLRAHRTALREGRSPTTRTEATLTCTQCDSRFSSKYKLRAHTDRVHLGYRYNKNIVCEVCGKHCTSNATLKYHQRTHTGEKPYSCETCAKQFSDSNQLRIHTRTHTGEKPYVCNTCGKRFTQKPALNRHFRVHTGAKPYICQYCSRNFSQSNSLKLHIRTIHLKLPTARKNRNSNNKTLGENGQKTENMVENA